MPVERDGADGLGPGTFRRLAANDRSVFPLERIHRPSKPVTRSPRVWGRYLNRLRVWRRANALVRLANSLDRGCCRLETPGGSGFARSDENRAAQIRIHNHVSLEASGLERKRLETQAPTGVQSLVDLLDREAQDVYFSKTRGHRPCHYGTPQN